MDKSLNQVIYERTVKSAGLVSPDLIVQELEALWSEGSGETPTWKWNREELYDEGTLVP